VLLLIEGDQHNADWNTGRKAGVGVSTLWHRPKWRHRRARNGRNYPGNLSDSFPNYCHYRTLSL